MWYILEVEIQMKKTSGTGREFALGDIKETGLYLHNSAKSFTQVLEVGDL